jgi:hypothetical protein
LREKLGRNRGKIGRDFREKIGKNGSLAEIEIDSTSEGGLVLGRNFQTQKLIRRTCFLIHFFLCFLSMTIGAKILQIVKRVLATKRTRDNVINVHL